MPPGLGLRRSGVNALYGVREGGRGDGHQVVKGFTAPSPAKPPLHNNASLQHQAQTPSSSRHAVGDTTPGPTSVPTSRVGNNVITNSAQQSTKTDGHSRNVCNGVEVDAVLFDAGVHAFDAVMDEGTLSKIGDGSDIIASFHFSKATAVGHWRSANDAGAKEYAN